MAKKKADNTAEIGFEQQIWSAADKLRGNIDASEYKNVVLGLIFLKYISDKFDQRHQELVEEGEGFEEDRDEYLAENIFFVPESARWATIAAAAHTPEVGKVIDEAMRQIEAENDKLKNILPKNFARQELDKRRLGEVVDLFTNVQMAEKGDTRDILGRTYEYCLAKFAEAEGKNAGEFYTPACIVKTLVEIIEPYHGRVYDPCCGSGGMFVQSAEFVKRHQGNIDDLLSLIHIYVAVSAIKQVAVTSAAHAGSLGKYLNDERALMRDSQHIANEDRWFEDRKSVV